MRLNSQWMWEEVAADVRQHLARQLRVLNLLLLEYLQFASCTSPDPGAQAHEKVLRASYLHDGRAKNALFDQSQPQLVTWKKIFFSSLFSLSRGQGLSHPPVREEQHLRGVSSHILFSSCSYSDALSAHPQPVPAPPAGTTTALGLTQPHLAVVVQPDLPARPLVLDTTTFILEGLLCGGDFVTPKPGSNSPLLLVSPTCVSRAAPCPLGRALKASDLQKGAVRRLWWLPHL